MEAANCLPKSCESPVEKEGFLFQNKVRHKNGTTDIDIKITSINNETLQNHCDVEENDDGREDDIEGLSSQFKDISTCSSSSGGKKIREKSPNGYWIGKTNCENGIDHKFGTGLHLDNDVSKVSPVPNVSSDSQPKNHVIERNDDDKSPPSSTIITTASPGNNANLDSSISEKNSDQQFENCQIQEKSGPYECSYVTDLENKSTALSIVDLSSSSSSTSVLPVGELGTSKSSVCGANYCLSPLENVLGGQLAIKLTNPSPIVNSDDNDEIRYEVYTSELQMGVIMKLIQKDLSEPYSIYTYRYFIHNWPKLCFLAMYGSRCVGAIVCKLDLHKKVIRRGYIAMLAVDEKYRKRKIGSNLVLQAIQAMIADDADEVVLETEISNKPALRLYENLGFVRDKRLFRYYLNGVDALRLKLWLH
ncbi:hypothetical protein CHUAL_009990 [Chamberlinius hualienensis]